MKTETTKPVPELTPELLERARAGDRDALADLYEATELEIYRTVHALLRDEDLSRDVQQDVYLRAFSRLDQLRDPAAFLPWLRQIAVNEARAQLRRRRPLLFSELTDEEEAELPDLPDVRPEASPELTLERKENARLVREILDELPDGQRLLLGMYYYEQMPIRQIAADTGISEGSVKTQLHRGRKRVEEAVRRLEAQGVKLFGLAPLPFLLALLKRLTPTAEGSRAALRGTLTRASLAPAAQAAGTAAGTTAAGTAASVAGTAVTDAAASFAGTAAVHVGRSFFETVLGKVVLGLITAAAIGGGVMGWNWYQNHINIGDVRPTETLEINLRYDSDEDLTTAPTADPTAEATTEPVTTASPEDLTTEPPTTEPVETTEPTNPTDPTSPTDPAGADAHIGPSSDPTDPVGADAHIGPSSESTIPSEEPTQPTEPSVILGWRWQVDTFNDESTAVEPEWDFDLNVDMSRGKHLVVSVKGDTVPILSSDRLDLISILICGPYFGHSGRYGQSPDWESTEGVKEYHWYIYPSGTGNGRLFCMLNGETVLSSVFYCPDPPSSFNDISVREVTTGSNWQTQLINECFLGEKYDIHFSAEGTALPEITTDNPNVVRLSSISFDPDRTWMHQVGSVQAQIVGPGDANVYVTWNGERQRAYSVHASYDDDDLYDSDEDLLPLDAPNQVLAWYAGDWINPKVVHTGSSFDLYVKMIGNELPILRTADPTIAVANSAPYKSASHGYNRYGYWFLIRGVTVGETTLICEFHGEVIFTLPIKVTDGS